MEAEAGGLQFVDGFGGDGGLEVGVAVLARALEFRPVAPIGHVLEDRVEVGALVLDGHADDVAGLDGGELVGLDDEGGAPAVKDALAFPDGHGESDIHCWYFPA